MMTARGWGRAEVLRIATGRWLGARTSQLAAAIAFHALLALAPLLLLLLGVAGRLLGREQARTGLADAARRFAGPEAEHVTTALLQLVTASPWRTTGTVLGAVLLLLGASSFFLQLRGALNAVWGAGHKGFRRLLLRRLVSLGETLLAVTAGLLVLALGVVRSVISPVLSARGAPGHWAFVGMSYFGIFVMTCAVLAAVYRFLPEVRPRPRGAAVLAGALPAALLLNLFSHAIGRFISASAVVSLYGAASSVIVALLWMYYSAWIVLLGAEVARAWDEAHPAPGPGAAA